jgi:hypothetical protein
LRNVRDECPLGADFIDKVGNVQRMSKDRIQASRFLNRCCAPSLRCESILLVRAPQNVYQHNLPESDLDGLRLVKGRPGIPADNRGVII